MKPLNLDNSPCSPVSSNCVIWQGPNIDCIDLCTGDSISTVVYKLATELCAIMNQLDLTNLDLACLKVGTNPPDTFSELIQLLINKICNTPTGSNLPAAITDPCPTNCIVPIAECFQSGTQTTMLLLDYVQMIGEKVCSLVDQIDTINTNITNIDKRVTILENKPVPAPYVLPSFIVDCTLKDNPDGVLAGTSHNLEVILTALVNDDTHGYCALLSSLGQPGNVFTAYKFQTNTSAGLYVPTLATSPSLFNCGTAMQSEYSSWIGTPQNLSDSFINLWITVSDIRKAHKTYEVKNVTGDTSVNITTTTATTGCGNKDTVTVSANLPIVAAGDNITVTPNTVANVTTYTVAGKETIVAAGTNIASVTPSPTVSGDTTYTVNAEGTIVESLTGTTNNTIEVTSVSNPTTNDTTYKVFSKYGLDSLVLGWHMKADYYCSWTNIPGALSTVNPCATPPGSYSNSKIGITLNDGGQTFIKPNYIQTTASTGVNANKNVYLTNFGPNLSITQAAFNAEGNTFATVEVATGSVTITEAGVYFIKAYIHLKPGTCGGGNEGGTFWMNDTTTTISGPVTSTATPPTTIGTANITVPLKKFGQIGIGIVPVDPDSIYTGDYQSVISNQTTQIDLTTSKLQYLNVGSVLRLNIVNQTDRTYSAAALTGGDLFSMEIIKISDGRVG